MTTLPPLPPHTVHRTQRLTNLQAHTMLSTFLATAQSDAAYRPDSVLSDRGPQSSSALAGSNLVLAHLDRIRRGIAGERIGGGDLGIGLGIGVSEGRGRKRKFEEEESVRVSTVEEPAESGQPGEVALEADGEGEGWIEKDDYELAQEDYVDGEMRVEEAQPGAVDASNQPLDAEEAKEQMRVMNTGKSEIDKKARRAAKAARKKEEKKLKEAKKIAG